MRISKESIGLIAIATFCFLGVNLYLDVFAYTYELNDVGDSLSYKEAAQMLFYEGKAHPTRPIGIAFFFGLIEGIHPILITVVHFFLWIATILILNKSFLLLTNKKRSFVLSLIFVVCVSNILFINLEITETLTAFLLTIISFQILKYALSKGTKHLLFASALLVLLVLIKPGFYYASITMALFAIWKSINGKTPIKVYAPLIISFAFLILNNSMVYKSYGKFKPSFIDDVTLYTYLSAYSQTEVRNTSTARIQRERREKMKSLTYAEIHDLAWKDIRFQIEYHPFVVFRYWAINTQNNASGGTVLIHGLNKIKNTIGKHQILYRLSQFQNILMVVLSLLFPIFHLLKYRKVDTFLVVTSILIWYIIFTSGISYFQGDRFHIGFYPMVLMQVAYFLFKKKAINIA